MDTIHTLNKIARERLHKVVIIKVKAIAGDTSAEVEVSLAFNCSYFYNLQRFVVNRKMRSTLMRSVTHENIIYSKLMIFIKYLSFFKKNLNYVCKPSPNSIHTRVLRWLFRHGNRCELLIDLT